MTLAWGTLNCFNPLWPEALSKKHSKTLALFENNLLKPEERYRLQLQNRNYSGIGFHTNSLNVTGPPCFFLVYLMLPQTNFLSISFRMVYSHFVALGNMVFVSVEKLKRLVAFPAGVNPSPILTLNLLIHGCSRHQSNCRTLRQCLSSRQCQLSEVQLQKLFCGSHGGWEAKTFFINKTV